MPFFRMAASLALAIAASAAVYPSQGHAQGVTGGWAVVSPSGKLGHNLNAVSATRVSAGVYEVRFNQDVSGCAKNATIGGRGKKSIVPGYIVASGGRHDDVVRVNTFLAVTLLPGDFRFSLAVQC